MFLWLSRIYDDNFYFCTIHWLFICFFSIRPPHHSSPGKRFLLIRLQSPFFLCVLLFFLLLFSFHNLFDFFHVSFSFSWFVDGKDVIPWVSINMKSKMIYIQVREWVEKQWEERRNFLMWCHIYPCAAVTIFIDESVGVMKQTAISLRAFFIRSIHLTSYSNAFSTFFLQFFFFSHIFCPSFMFCQSVDSLSACNKKKKKQKRYTSFVNDTRHFPVKWKIYVSLHSFQF